MATKTSPATVRPGRNRLRRGHQALNAGDLERARRCAHQRLANDAGDVDALVLMGSVLLRERRYAEALDPLNRAASLDARRDDALARLGQALSGLGQSAQARKAYELSLALKPEQSDVELNLGIIERDDGETESARQRFERSIQLNPRQAQAYANLGLVHWERDMPKLAEWYVLAALELNPENDTAHTILGSVLRSTGSLSRAEAAFRRALETRPDSIQALFSLAQSKRFKPDDPDLDLFRQKASYAGNWSAYDRVRFFFAWGKALDDAGRYDEAFQLFAEGNRQQRERVSFDTDLQDRFVDNLIELFSHETVASLRDAGNPESRPIFILGMPRSGTTLTEQIIASHPQVVGAGELPYLRDALRTTFPADAPVTTWQVDGDALRNVGDDYLRRLLEHGSDVPYTTDKMPANFRFLGFIRLALPNARIVHCRREPADTCLSCFQRLFDDRQAFTYDLRELGRYYRGYERLMDHWRDVFPGEFYELQYEDLVADTEGESRRLIEALGLEWDDCCLAFQRRKSTVYTASAWQVRQPVYKSAVQRWRRYERHLAPLLEALGC